MSTNQPEMTVTSMLSLRLRAAGALALALPLALAPPGSAHAGPRCPAAPIRLDHLELGLFYASAAPPASRGIDHELVQELARRSGCAIDARLVVRDQTWNRLRDGQADMTVNGIRSDARAEFAWFVPYVRVYHEVLLGKGAPPALRSLADFEAAPGLAFGVVRGYRHNPFYDSLLAKWRSAGRVREYPDEAALIAALRRGEVAAMLSYPATYHYYLSKEQVRREVRVASWNPAFDYVTLNLVISKKMMGHAEAQQWQELLRTMRQDGTLLRIFQHYLDAQEARTMLP